MENKFALLFSLFTFTHPKPITMKKLLLLSVVFTTTLSFCFSQAPQRFNYQGVARDNSGNILANQAVGLQLTIHQGSASGAIVYQETQSITTNSFGLFAVEVGGGIIVQGSMGSIVWANGPFFFETEMDASGGSNYLSMGTQQLLSVPYALYAETAGNSGATGATGASGNDGATGATGSDGATGATGAAGPTGATGLQGVQGLQGNVGANGATGATGIAGATGANGATGAAGATGIAGATGVTGSTGSSGANGDRYATTSTTTLTIGTGTIALTIGTSLNYSTGQTVIIANTSTNQMTGTVTGYNSGTGVLNVTITSTSGSGTYSLWSVNLNGAPGPAGAIGLTGTTGPTGATGAIGPAGPTGSIGATGATGSQGIQGLTGATGPQGVQGVQGVQGNVGATGAANINGTTNYVVKFTGATTGGNSSIYDNGNVGIGTTSPATKFHITGGNDAALATSTSGYLLTGTTTGTNIVMDDNELMARNNGAKSALYLQHEGGDIMIHGSQLGGTQVIVLDNGNTGIGTSSADEKLQVEGVNATLRLKNTNDAIGGFAGDAYSSLQLGLYNPTGSVVGSIAANTKQSIFGMNSSAMVGSLTNAFGSPAWGNLLDAGATGRLHIGYSLDGSGSANNGTWASGHELVFGGSSSGAGIASNRSGSGDNQSGLDFYTLSGKRMSITTTGNVGIATATPAAKLDVAGTFKLVDGTQGTDKVLTSDANGLASWKDLPGKQVAFMATQRYWITDDIGSSFTRVICDTVSFNYGNGYNSSTGIFTAPLSGMYNFNCNIDWILYNVSGFWHGKLRLRKFSPSPLIEKVGESWSDASDLNSNLSILIFLNAGDQVDFGVEVISKPAGSQVGLNWIGETNYIYGYKVF